jgi:hypothetical protein
MCGSSSVCLKFSIVMQSLIDTFVTMNMWMDCIILLQFGGPASEQFQLVGIRPHVLTFEKPPSFNELVARVRAVMNVKCELRLHGRYDMGGNRSIYVKLPLGFEDE